MKRISFENSNHNPQVVSQSLMTIGIENSDDKANRISKELFKDSDADQ